MSSAPLPPPVGSISTADAAGTTAPASGGVTLNSSDWNYARGALGLALTGTESGPPVPWANPETGTRGAFAPKSAAVTNGGQTCRDFTAHQVEEGREVELSGPIHSKGVMILAAYLASRYSSDRPHSLGASLVCEQTYGAVEGDSASVAELCALLSSLGQFPLLQSLADAARRAGFARLTLSVEHGNFAEALYRSEGFTVVGTRGGRDTMVRRLR